LLVGVGAVTLQAAQGQVVAVPVDTGVRFLGSHLGVALPLSPV